MHIAIRNLSFGYSTDSLVLHKINLNVDEGNTLAIVGASGSGKSTLLRIISGIISPNVTNHFNGEVLLDGKNIWNEFDHLKEKRKQGKVGFMFQEPTLFPNLTVRENIELPLKITQHRKDIDRKVSYLLESVGLKDYHNYLPAQLSGGMKTRVALARTFTTEPKLLLLDEPFASLDIVWKIKLYKEVEKLKQEYNTTVIIVTHDIQEALYFSNHIIVTGKGEELNSLNIIDKKLPRDSYEESVKDFQSEFLLIQNLILVNGEREVITDYEMLIALEKIEKMIIGKEHNENLSNLLSSIHRGAKTEEFHNRLKRLWEIATTEQKLILSFALLDFEKISNDLITQIQKFILYSHWNEFVFYLRNQKFYREEAPLDITLNSMKSNENPPSKKWIFACAYCAYLNDTNAEVDFLNRISSEYSTFPLMTETIMELNNKLKNNF